MLADELGNHELAAEVRDRLRAIAADGDLKREARAAGRLVDARRIWRRSGIDHARPLFATVVKEFPDTKAAETAEMILGR